MHTLGKRVVTAVNDMPVVDIPRWDFHGQQAYQFQTPLTLHATDTLVVECTYDNSYENQPEAKQFTEVARRGRFLEEEGGVERST